MTGPKPTITHEKLTSAHAEEAPLLDVAEHVCEMYPFTGPALADSLLRRFAKRPETRAVWDRRKKDFSPPHTEDF